MLMERRDLSYARAGKLLAAAARPRGCWEGQPAGVGTPWTFTESVESNSSGTLAWAMDDPVASMGAVAVRVSSDF